MDNEKLMQKQSKGKSRGYITRRAPINNMRSIGVFLSRGSLF